MDPADAAGPAQSQRRRWLPYLVGALAGAALTVAVVAVFADGGADDDHRDAAVTSTTIGTGTGTGTATSAPSTTGGSSGTLASPPAIVGFGVTTTNCPAGASTTTVVVSYETENATRVAFAVDDGALEPSLDTSGSRAVGPVPCDAQQHVITMIAEEGRLRASRQATVSVS